MVFRAEKPCSRGLAAGRRPLGGKQVISADTMLPIVVGVASIHALLVQEEEEGE
jgi:hypothetical protein